jgi:hypothetical protein
VIEFVILNPASQKTQHLEFAQAAVSFSLEDARYSAYAREYSADEIERLSAKAFRAKCPETGEGFMVAVLSMSEKLKNAPDAAQRHLKAYLGHALRRVVAKEIERANTST